MTGVLEVSADWLALREAEDARSRSRRLARLAAGLAGDARTRPLTVHDLGSGTGSMMRWLAPQLPGPQAWILHDWNAGLTAHATDAEPPRDRAGRPVAVAPRVTPLDRLASADLAGADLVTASALLDVVTAQEAHAIVDACLAAGAPAFLPLSVTGDVELRPWDRRDIRFARAFNEHQRREVDGRRLLGRFGAPIVRGLFERAGWHVRTALTTWRLDGRDPRLLGEWFDGWADAAVEQAEADRDRALLDQARDYRALRREQQRHGGLSAVVYHLDVLAWPR
ncbi:SAM-dependent methyltransferase [Leifsonia shinshuensis]|uniref:SAM-dependent methyltransferase n=1 Tax=Leifsonia shinshuensis TaxID=150026 RepID=A0A7G6YBA1_9MICO|nr:SAM-dependent methyltransferase [Leifsonia shinshuensis]QNE35766.1 SAM-dependent methyltransferase [Leifsonia shinshuensis]